ncbi:phage tail tape measure protein [Lentibacillus cibarius]|uniref:Phage tail tape measure protein n=1 Tax=Lentibacillus cibarius TaxID=2583219 RepID=A0A5S3QRA1_9BACI|nr:phage tail tape measure protein [Lentibacillus cibarius]TMN23156.1 phage tail tape measure protein [Lentibacillus cibarius]
MASLAELMVKVGADIGDFQSKMSKVDKSIKDVSSSMKKNGKAMAQTGSNLTKSISVPLTTVAGTAVAMSSKYEAQMSKVQAVTGTTGDNFKELKGLARELGRTTQYSAVEAGQGMEFLARAGWNNQQIMKGLPQVLNLAKAGALDLGSASDIVSNIMSGFGASAGEAQRYVDVLAKASSSANTDVNQMGEAMKYVAPVANDLGLSVEETASAIGVMSDAGIQGSQAGTTLRQGLLKLSSPTKQAKGLMDELNMSFFNAEGQMKSLPEIISTLEQGMSGLSQEQRTQALSTMFGAEAVSGFSALLNRGSEETGAFTKELQNADGTAQNMAETMGDNLQGRLKELWSQITDIGISLGQSLTPYIEKAVSWFSQLADWVSNLSGKVKAGILVFGVLATVLPPLLAVIGFMVQGVGLLAGAFTAISAPVLAVIAGVVALGVALGVLWNKSETFRETVKQVFTKIKEVVLSAMKTVGSFLKSKLNQIKKFWDENGSQILKAVENAFNGIKAVIEFVMPFIKGVIKYVWNAIKGIINGALDAIMGVVKIFTGLFTGDFSKMWEGVKQLFSGAIEFVWNLMNLSFVGGIKKLILGFTKKIWSWIKGLWDDIVLKFMYGKDKVVGFITNLKSKGLSIFNTLKNRVKSIFEKVKDFITNPIKTAKDTVKDMIDKIKGFFSGLKLKIPKPKLPKISVTKKKGVLGIPYPDFDVSWNAKGAIFNGATLLGGGQGVGEAGAEAVLPIQHKRYMKPFASAVADHLQPKEPTQQVQPQKVTVEVPVYMNGREVARSTVDDMSRLLFEKQKRTNRRK